MAYFPNGTSGMVYQERWCGRCRNYKPRGDWPEDCCPIWDLHLRFDYKQTKDSELRAALNMLIPMDRDGVYPQKCTMFTKEQ